MYGSSIPYINAQYKKVIPKKLIKPYSKCMYWCIYIVDVHVCNKMDMKWMHMYSICDEMCDDNKRGQQIYIDV